jgi:hypothetical protein
VPAVAGRFLRRVEEEVCAGLASRRAICDLVRSVEKGLKVHCGHKPVVVTLRGGEVANVDA